ncbi:MAG: hypothetical protein IPM85_15140 [Chitinophagaceae bacterium]|nr:hypothetical protein [Chitinophagaceae bacterium]
MQKSLPCSYASGTHPTSVDTDIQFKLPRRRANIQQEFAAMLADEYIFSFISLSAHIQLTEFYQLLLLSSSSVFQIGSGSGLDIIKYQHSSKLWPLGASNNELYGILSTLYLIEKEK